MIKKKHLVRPLFSSVTACGVVTLLSSHCTVGTARIQPPRQFLHRLFGNRQQQYDVGSLSVGVNRNMNSYSNHRNNRWSDYGIGIGGGGGDRGGVTASSFTALPNWMDISRGGAGPNRKTVGKSNKVSSSISSTAKKTATGKRKVGTAEDAVKSKKHSFLDRYAKKLKPLTRIYLAFVVVMTVAGIVLGEELIHEIASFDPVRAVYGLELWRLLTAAAYLGPPSMGWLFGIYYLSEYGSSLEGAFGTAQFLIFLLSQLTLLSILSGLLGQPFFAQSVVTSMLQVLCRSMPNKEVKWILFDVPYWFLPYAFMISDVLQAQNVGAAMPHIMGMISGHFYHFHKFVWPKIGGEDWLTAPNFIVRRLDPDAKMDFASSASPSSSVQDMSSKTLKGRRKRGGGKKLGGSS